MGGTCVLGRPQWAYLQRGISLQKESKTWVLLWGLTLSFQPLYSQVIPHRGRPAAIWAGERMEGFLRLMQERRAGLTTARDRAAVLCPGQLCVALFPSAGRRPWHLQAPPSTAPEKTKEKQPFKKQIFLCSPGTELSLVNYCRPQKNAASFPQLSLPMASLWCHCSMIPQMLKVQSSYPQSTGQCSHQYQQQIKWASQPRH